MRRRAAQAVAAVALALLGTACRVAVDVAVAVGTDGAGQVTVTVDLDPGAAAQVPDLDSRLAVGDLRAAGWEVTPTQGRPDGGAVLRARKDVDGLPAAQAALTELTGPGGPLGSLRLTRQAAAFSTRTSLRGALDLSAGLAGFSDPVLQERLDGLPVGVDAAALAAELGAPGDDVVRVRLRADFPGAAATFEGRLGQVVPVAVSSSRVNGRRVALVALSAASAAALAGVQLARRRSRA